ncbi:MAG TPA: pyridoxamine 5'-phosphate oxidase [Stackebrandtia sp.]|uniref:pyridoxamine 5'-phosphate oxidase n=1 Tax=Stackebrandtia sp. TaxID=2023065 RepID=UPI002D6F2A42|nr:pyridoxamine 5'-phosphate oxidase [Stackebrandtia sp.]HZE42111.1 pyridoxamine 5'-phosphate oxidase [Stackebrandtia sp.]
MTRSDDLSQLRRDYSSPSLDEADAAADPITQFRGWFDAARDSEATEANAMVLATVDAQGRPQQRTVLLKAVDERGFTFFTNYESDKGRQIAGNPEVSLLFGWYIAHRQVRVCGAAARVPRAETEDYFATRPRGSQLAAWASAQSRRLGSRAELDAEVEAMGRRFGDEVPAPPHWGGYRVEPRTVEFWQGRRDRLHDRLRYQRDENDGWVVERLAP